MTEKILLVDDEPEMLRALYRILKRKGYIVSTANCGKDAWSAIEKTMFDLVISDMAMEDITGLELLKMARATDSTLPFIILTGVGTIESAVEAIKIGAFHYITKPFKSRDIEIIALRALEYGKLNRQLKNIEISDVKDNSKKMLVGKSKPMNDLMKSVDKISDSMASVLITGETGTGKSLLARHIHNNSSRRNKPYLTIDCGALTETILESELFGHVKGAFTGAIHAKRGLLEEGHGGTVFLDEIGEMSTPTQTKLLRAIQEGLIKPVGGNQTVKIDVRFISASSKDFQNEIQKGNFREDLYYRLAVIPISLPSLRERIEDIPLLVDHFLKLFCMKYKKKIKGLSADVLEMFENTSWKGNIRELSNILERGVLLSDTNIITLDCLLQSNIIQEVLKKNETSKKTITLKSAVENAEIKTIVQALNNANNNRSEAARALGISRRALYDKLACYNLDGQ